MYWGYSAESSKRFVTAHNEKKKCEDEASLVRQASEEERRQKEEYRCAGKGQTRRSEREEKVIYRNVYLLKLGNSGGKGGYCGGRGWIENE